MKSFFAVVGLLIILTFGWYFSNHIKLILKEPASSWIENHSADCAVVLTGGPYRVQEGFDLLSQNQVKKLIISGVNPKANLREIFPQWPYYGGLNEADVVLEKQSMTTYGNAQQSLQLIEALNCRDIVLITSRLHMLRSFKTFRAIIPDNIPIYKRAVVSGHYEPPLIDTIIEGLKSVFYSLWTY